MNCQVAEQTHILTPWRSSRASICSTPGLRLTERYSRSTASMAAWV